MLIKQGTNENLYYTFTDQLGSIISLLNPDGTLAESYSYDAWGRRRNPISWTYDSIPTPTLIDRGFTGHEHLDEFGLINMNGRMYDPALGRFLSVDPFIQFPENAQSYNGYGYCLNNPLLYSDPSGYLLSAREAYAEAVKSDYDLSYADFLGDYMSQYFDMYFDYLLNGSGGTRPYTMTFRWKSPGKNVLWDIKKTQKENPDGIMLGEVIKDGGYAGIHSITINVGSWGFPSDNRVLNSPVGEVKIGDYFGQKRRFGTSPHLGTDYLVPTGTQVHSTASGTVVRADYSSSYGNIVIVNHGNNVYTLYGHGSKNMVYVGNPVFTNQVIMLSGNTGHSTGAHLHYEVIYSLVGPSNKEFYGNINSRRSPLDLNNLIYP